MEKLPFTEIGLNKLKKEMTDLKSIERPAIIKAIAEARSHGIYQRMLSTMQLENAKVLLRAVFLN